MVGTSAPAPAPKAAAGPASASSKSGSTKTKATKAAAGTKSKAKKPRRKKPTTKAPSAASAQAIWSAARAAQVDLAQQRAQAAARRSDPLWYRIEDVLPVGMEDTAMVQNTSALPEQVQIVENALSHNNLTRGDVTPQAFACLLEQARRYALELMADAKDYAAVANRHEITRPDLLLASEMRPDHPTAAFTDLPKLNLLAKQINRVPLPPIPSQCYSGVLLPPKSHQLTARTFDVVSGAQVAQKVVAPAPAAPKPPSKNKPGYGAARGRQIAVNLKETEAPVPMDTSGSDGTPKAATTTSSTAPSGTQPLASVGAQPGTSGNAS